MLFMNKALEESLKGFKRTDGATLDAIASIEESFNRKLPDELRQILAESDGIAGVISKHELQSWSAAEIVAYNRANSVQDDCPAFLMFGSDGGGTTYTLDYRTEPPSVVLVEAIGFDYKSAIPVGSDFMSFLDRLKNPRSLYEKLPAS
jgi:hypothetical protein